MISVAVTVTVNLILKEIPVTFVHLIAQILPMVLPLHLVMLAIARVFGLVLTVKFVNLTNYVMVAVILLIILLAIHANVIILTVAKLAKLVHMIAHLPATVPLKQLATGVTVKTHMVETTAKLVLYNVNMDHQILIVPRVNAHQIRGFLEHCVTNAIVLGFNQIAMVALQVHHPTVVAIA